jgi:hypothetical protein
MELKKFETAGSRLTIESVFQKHKGQLLCEKSQNTALPAARRPLAAGFFIRWVSRWPRRCET